jgi:molecular chaperone DnaK (HSP70)
LNEVGHAAIVDCGASKAEVSLLECADGDCRELRTAGDTHAGTGAIAAGLVEPIARKLREQVAGAPPSAEAAVPGAVAAALTSPSGRLVIDLGKGKKFETTIAPPMVTAAAEPIAARIGRLCREACADVVAPGNVKTVYCPGGGSRIAALKAAIQKAFPKATLVQLDQNDAVVSGAALDGAQATGRLPEKAHLNIRGVVPYSIGTSVVGDIITKIIERGELLPASGETSVVTVTDNQTAMDLSIYQGEHVLAELTNNIGTTRLEGLPKMARRQCTATIRVVYDENGILHFSAEEARSHARIDAVFSVKSAFSEEEERTWLQAKSAADEIRVANTRYMRRQMEMDIERAEAQVDAPGFQAAITKWSEWLALNARDAGVSDFLTARWELRNEFWNLDKKKWEQPPKQKPPMEFTPLWPPSPGYTNDGAVIIRFLSSPALPEVLAKATEVGTDNAVQNFDICQFGGR